MISNATVRIDFSEFGECRLVATDPDDNSTITDAVDLGRDGTSRRLWILGELLRREGLRAVNSKNRTVIW